MAIGSSDPQVHRNALAARDFSIDSFHAFYRFQALYQVGQVTSVRHVNAHGALKHALASVNVKCADVNLHVARNDLSNFQNEPFGVDSRKPEYRIKTLPAATVPDGFNHSFCELSLKLYRMTAVHSVDLNATLLNETKNRVALNRPAARGKSKFKDDLIGPKKYRIRGR